MKRIEMNEEFCKFVEEFQIPTDLIAKLSGVHWSTAYRWLLPDDNHLQIKVGKKVFMNFVREWNIFCKDANKNQYRTDLDEKRYGKPKSTTAD